MNAQWPLSTKTLSCELWILGAICWFGKTHLSDSTIFKSVDFDQQLADKLSWRISAFHDEFSKLKIESLDMPVSLNKALNGLSVARQDLFLLFLCSEIENNYWLNLAIQELQGPQENPYPKIHLICELLSTLFSVRLTPTDIYQHFFVVEELLIIQLNGPVALASVQVNKAIWLEMIESNSSPQIRRILADNKPLDLIGCHVHSETNDFQYGPIIESDPGNIHIQNLQHIEKHKSALDYLSLEFRLKKISRLQLYAPIPQALAFVNQLAEMLDLIPVVPDQQLCEQPKKLFWFSRAFDWLPVLLLDEPAIINSINIRSVVIATHKKSNSSFFSLMDSSQVAEYRITKEDYAERFSGWSEWIDVDLANQLAKRWLMSSSMIPAIMKQVKLSNQKLTDESLENAILQARLDLAPESLGDLAIHLPQKIHHKAVIFPKSIDEDLNRLLQRCRNRDDIFTQLGYSTTANQNKGVKALFSGESGTGKTLAASYIASQLGIPIYRMDLGSILNKYIGETEKNITRVMNEACDQDFILLIDEADALFGKRTDVESSGERFANMLTNYLLSRIEQYSGIVLMTTNGMGRIDSAFMRRLDMIIEFNSPELAERTRIWQSHLGNRSPGEQYCRQLASLCDLTGGYIRNAVLAAAADLPYAKDSTLPYSLLLRTLANEYRKSGKPIPPKLAAQITATL
jgi:ATPase family associated with various cellular activities (AAA)